MNAGHHFPSSPAQPQAPPAQRPRHQGLHSGDVAGPHPVGDAGGLRPRRHEGGGGGPLRHSHRQVRRPGVRKIREVHGKDLLRLESRTELHDVEI